MTVVFHPYTDFLLIVGMMAQGKTTITKHYCKSLKPLIAIDPTWQLGEVGYCVHFPERILAAYQKFKKVIYQPKKMDTLTYQRAFQVCLSLINYTLVIDEIDTFAKPNWYKCDEVEQIIKRGRAQGIGIIGNTRRPANTHNDLKNNVYHVVCFKLHGKSDVDYMSEWLNIDKMEIKGLQKYHSLYYNVTEGTVTKQAPLY